MSAIDASLSDREKAVLDAYRDPHRGIGRATRMSVQYAIGAAIFLYLAISTNDPRWSLVVYAIFVCYLIVRLIGARRMAGAMPSIIEKYEARIRQLEQASPATHY